MMTQFTDAYIYASQGLNELTFLLCCRSSKHTQINKIDCATHLHWLIMRNADSPTWIWAIHDISIYSRTLNDDCSMEIPQPSQPVKRRGSIIDALRKSPRKNHDEGREKATGRRSSFWGIFSRNKGRSTQEDGEIVESSLSPSKSAPALPAHPAPVKQCVPGMVSEMRASSSEQLPTSSTPPSFPSGLQPLSMDSLDQLGWPPQLPTTSHSPMLTQNCLDPGQSAAINSSSHLSAVHGATSRSTPELSSCNASQEWDEFCHQRALLQPRATPPTSGRQSPQHTGPSSLLPHEPRSGMSLLMPSWCGSNASSQGDADWAVGYEEPPQLPPAANPAPANVTSSTPHQTVPIIIEPSPPQPEPSSTPPGLSPSLQAGLESVFTAALLAGGPPVGSPSMRHRGSADSGLPPAALEHDPAAGSRRKRSTLQRFMRRPSYPGQPEDLDAVDAALNPILALEVEAMTSTLTPSDAKRHGKKPVRRESIFTSPLTARKKLSKKEVEKEESEVHPVSQTESLGSSPQPPRKTSEPTPSPKDPHKPLNRRLSAIFEWSLENDLRDGIRSDMLVSWPETPTTNKPRPRILHRHSISTHDTGVSGTRALLKCPAV